MAFSPHRYDTFADAPSASSAAAFNTREVDFARRCAEATNVLVF
ncbi:MAG: hypothetical protein ACRDJW_00925 [Thermomicrobiales bacterium]